MIIVLSYGTRDHLYATDTCYEANFLFNHFTADKCPTLAGKPKLFFIQACAYCNVLDSGITPFMQKETDLTNSTFCIERDFLIFYSTIPGILSYLYMNILDYYKKLLILIRYFTFPLLYRSIVYI